MSKHVAPKTVEPQFCGCGSPTVLADFGVQQFLDVTYLTGSTVRHVSFSILHGFPILRHRCISTNKIASFPPHWPIKGLTQSTDSCNWEIHHSLAYQSLQSQNDRTHQSEYRSLYVSVCGTGNYVASGKCYQCMIGTYQSLNGQTSCTACSAPKSTTSGVGSRSSSECSIFFYFFHAGYGTALPEYTYSFECIRKCLMRSLTLRSVEIQVK